MRTKIEEITIPAIALRGLVVFPKMNIQFELARKKSIAALKAALKTDKKVFLVPQKDDNVKNPSKKDLYNYGVVAEVRQSVELDDKTMRLLVEGLYRAKLSDLSEEEPYLVAKIKPSYEPKSINKNDVELRAVMKVVKGEFERYSFYIPDMPADVVEEILNENNPYKLFYRLIMVVAIGVDDKVVLLQESHITSKLGILSAIMSREIEVFDLEDSINRSVNVQLTMQQRQAYLKEKMKAISKQLGENTENEDNEENDYIDRINKLKLDEETRTVLLKEAEILKKLPSSSQEASVVRNYLDNVLDLPWNTYTKDRADFNKVKSILDKDHYGLEKVKEQILENIAVRKLKPDVKGQIICLVGPPGIGKTSIGKSIARSLGKNYQRISLGGVRDESDIRGHRKTYVGAMPGRIINAMKLAKSRNPVILLDEIDKMTRDMRGDPSSALLEVLDSEQNNAFRDHYIEVPFDLSDVLFITTANTTQTIEPPLLDRMDVIELTSYTREEKFNIAKKHLIPKQLKANGLTAAMLKISDKAVYILIDNYTKEAGVRKLERCIAKLCRKTAKIIISNEQKAIRISEKNIEEFLGVKKYCDDELMKTNEIGIVNGLAWTSVGGVVMPLEVAVFDGKGTIETTGSLGDVMKESAKLAVSYVRSIAEKYGISTDFYKKKDIHIHAPEGATPKDGPSAGVTMTTALVSALADIPVRHDVAMTGEITLHGKVLTIGGLREKTMAAYKAGMKTVVIPIGNKGDLEEVDTVVKENINFVFAEKISDVLEVALENQKLVSTMRKQKSNQEICSTINS